MKKSHGTKNKMKKYRTHYLYDYYYICMNEWKFKKEQQFFLYINQFSEFTMYFRIVYETTNNDISSRRSKKNSDRLKPT